MSYADQANLYSDPVFKGRLQAAVLKESRGRPDSAVAEYSLEYPPSGMQMFLPWVTTEPGFDVPEPVITDGMLLAAVQAVWGNVETQGIPGGAA